MEMVKRNVVTHVMETYRGRKAEEYLLILNLGTIQSFLHAPAVLTPINNSETH
jgi:hypothetical protein